MAYHRDALTLYGAAQVGGSAVGALPPFVKATLNGNPDFLLTKGSVDPNIRIVNYLDPHTGKAREYHAMQYMRTGGAWHPWVIVHGESTATADHILAWPAPPGFRPRSEMVEKLVQDLFRKLVHGLAEAMEPGVDEEPQHEAAEVAPEDDGHGHHKKSRSKARSARPKK